MPRGRQTKLTPERETKIVQAILAGNYFSVACRYAGVPEQTGYEWLARGEGRDPRGRPATALYAKFAEAVRQAEAQSEFDAVDIVRNGLKENPRLALDFLARRHPSRWGQKDTMTILRKLAGEMDKMTDDELFAIVERRSGGSAGEAGAAEIEGAGPDRGE